MLHLETNQTLESISCLRYWCCCSKKRMFVGWSLHKLNTGDSVDTKAYDTAEEISSKIEVDITNFMMVSWMGWEKTHTETILYKKIDTDGTKQTITLNYLSHPVRCCGGHNNDHGKLKWICNECLANKLKMIQNPISKIRIKEIL